MSALGKMVRAYEEQIDILTKALEEIRSMPFKSDHPYTVHDAAKTAHQALEDARNVDFSI